MLDRGGGQRILSIQSIFTIQTIFMGLLDALAKSPPGEARVPASMLFYDRESFHVEHHPRSRVSQWKPWLEARRFGIVALGYAQPGERESELVKRIDQFAGLAVSRALSSQ